MNKIECEMDKLLFDGDVRTDYAFLDLLMASCDSCLPFEFQKKKGQEKTGKTEQKTWNSTLYRSDENLVNFKKQNYREKQKRFPTFWSFF